MSYALSTRTRVLLRAVSVTASILLAPMTLSAAEQQKITEGHARELARIHSIFLVTNDASLGQAFRSVLGTRLPEVAIAPLASDADGIAVLTSTISRETLSAPDSGGCKPCQAQNPPDRVEIETRTVVLSILVPTGPDEFRRVLLKKASGGFGNNLEERVATEFASAWRKWSVRK